MYLWYWWKIWYAIHHTQVCIKVLPLQYILDNTWLALYCLNMCWVLIDRIPKISMIWNFDTDVVSNKHKSSGFLSDNIPSLHTWCGSRFVRSRFNNKCLFRGKCFCFSFQLQYLLGGRSVIAEFSHSSISEVTGVIQWQIWREAFAS